MGSVEIPLRDTDEVYIFSLIPALLFTANILSYHLYMLLMIYVYLVE
jgi:hypothetical protein